MGTTRRLYDNTLMQLKSRVANLERAYAQLRNDPLVTLPIRDENDFPAEPGDGELVLGEDGVAYKYQDGAWLPIGGSGTGNIVFSSPGFLSETFTSPIYKVFRNGTIDFIDMTVTSGPTGSSLVVRVIKNGISSGTGTTIGTGTFTVGQTTKTISPSPATFVSGDYFAVEISQVGSIIPGANLVIQLVL